MACSATHSAQSTLNSCQQVRFTRAGIIDEERKIKHRKFSERVEEVITKPEKINLKLKSDSVDIAYPPVVQSGGTYDLK